MEYDLENELDLSIFLVKLKKCLFPNVIIMVFKSKHLNRLPA